MRKVLVLSDCSCGITGFSSVAKHILRDIHDTGLYEIIQIGINYDGSGYDYKEIPYKIIPAASALDPRYNDVMGRPRFLDILSSGEVDIVWILQDMAAVTELTKEIKVIYDGLPKEKKFVTIMYTPVDSDLPTKRNWVVNSLCKIDYPVIYTEYGLKQVSQFDPGLAKRARVCLHGIDTTEYYPIPKEKAEEYKKQIFKNVSFGNKFIILNVNRNQIRKDYLRTFKTIAELKKIYPNIMLIAFAAITDQGGDLNEIATQCGLKLGADWVAPGNYTSWKGLPVSEMNKLYAISDCVFSSTVGEGFGLSSIEAMATKRPCVFPRNSALPEIFGENEERGLLVASGNTPNNFICYGGFDSSLVRPTIDVEDAVAKLSLVIKGGEAIDSKVENGYLWAKEHDWKKINEFWIWLFAKAGAEVDRRRGNR